MFHGTRRLIITIFAVFMLILILAWVGFSYSQYHYELDNAHRGTQNIAFSLQQHAQRTIEKAEGTLSSVVQIAASYTTIEEIESQRWNSLKLGTSGITFVTGIQLFGVDGQRVRSPLSPIFNLENVSNEDFFLAHVGGNRTSLFLGTARKVPGEASWHIPISLPLRNVQGTFQGVAVAWITSEIFTDLYTAIDVGKEGVVALLKKEGWLLARAPVTSTMIGKNFSHSPVFEHFSKQDHGTFESLYVHDQSPRISGYSNLKAYNLVVLVGRDKDELLASWRQLTLQAFIVLIAVGIVFGILAVLLMRQVSGRENAEARTKEAEQLADELNSEVVQRKRVEAELRRLNDTLEKQVEERTIELEAALEQAESASLAKDEFLASMSHELRTPLTAIIGNSEFLSDKEQDGDKQKLISSIEMAGRGQLALVNDILDMSKIESGKFTIDEVPYDLAVLLRDIEHLLSSRALDAGLDLVVEQTNRENHLLIGDGQRIGQILINLIGNAIKFTEMGTVSLTTRTVDEHLHFIIKDSGIGMSPEVLERLFQRFEQADGSISRRFGGSGLGLFISLNLAEMMGGTIDVSSQEGVGSVFELILPYRPSDLPVEREATARSDSVLEEKLSGHVLVAEDTPELQLLERRILEGLGLTVTTANNGREAVDLATSHSFDLILMDMQMPVIDGIEATKLLRSQDNRVPIVALTANVMQKHRELFNQAGCDGFLSKPIDRQELRRMISKYLRS